MPRRGGTSYRRKNPEKRIYKWVPNPETVQAKKRWASLGAKRWHCKIDRWFAHGKVNFFRNKIKQERKAAMEETWVLNGQGYTRRQIMEKVIDWIADGNPLKMFCDQSGAPTIGTVYRWFKNHPDFEKDFYLAEAAGGHALGDRALIEALQATEKDDVPVAKLRYDALVRRAAQMNQKFQDKQVFRQEEDIKSISEDELIRRRNELFDKVKEELKSSGWKEPDTLPDLLEDFQDAELDTKKEENR